MIDQIINNFHFIREEYLWGFLPLLVLTLFVFRKAKQEDNWKKNIPDHIISMLLVEGKENSKFPRILLLLITSLFIFSSAGPTWEIVEKPGVKSKASLVIALDLSRSMLVEDIQPNRLERAKSKISSLLDIYPKSPTALVGFAGTAHTVLHFAEDYKTIKYLLEYTSPSVMPLRGSNIKSMMLLADSLLNPTELPGTILVITDNIDVKDLNIVKDYIKDSMHKIEFYFVSTPGGGLIPTGKNKFLKYKGQTVHSGLNVDLIGELQGIKGVNVNLITLDDSDIEQIASNIKENLILEKKTGEEEEDWKDLGYWFMIPGIILSLLWFRKGWVVNWIFLISFLPGMGCSEKNSVVQSKESFEFIDLWFTEEYQAQRLFDVKRYAEAATKFENNFMKGVSYYKAKEFNKAAQYFYLEKTPQSYFNLGMCMAELENWNEAVFAFEEALNIYPDFMEAKENLIEIKKLIPKEKPIELVTPQSFEDKFLSRSEELDQESEEKGDKEEQDGGDKNKEEQVASAVAPQNQSINPEIDNNEERQQEDIKNTILNQMSDDPSVFLKRKFQFQYKKLVNQGKTDNIEKKW